ncbi:MAG: rRNA pseudouridine synthase [Alphaproteobacteria bacterium]|nr:rRNA pseudouridine synthase [Alphaproteobacteria bacterium]
MAETEDKERIAKRIARAGVASRRDAERLILFGRVKLNGEVLTTPAITVGPDDVILVDDKPLPGIEPARLWRYHKAKGVMTTHRDPEGRPTLFEALPAGMPRVISVGRLDYNSEGLILLTNDGGIARKMELPETGWTRRYRVRVHGRVDPARLAELAKGVTVEGVRYGPIEAALDREQGTNAWLTLALKEGKNREVRRIMEHLGLPVTRLIRIAYGPFQLGQLQPGEIDEVPKKVLREQLGLPGPQNPAVDKPEGKPAYRRDARRRR